MAGRKEGSVLFNDALNTFYLRLYGVRHMVEDHSDSERGNPLPPHGLLFRLTARVLLYAPSHRQDSTYHGLCYTSRGEIAQWVHPMKDRSNDPLYHERTLLPRSYISLLACGVLHCVSFLITNHSLWRATLCFLSDYKP